jgi:alpha-tubulin suppressor-like RCC1 family protein
MCGGSNEDGELGDGTTQGRTEPVAVLGLEAGVKAICAGFSHNCAITSEDEVYCWGTIATVKFENGVGWRHPAPTRVDGFETGVKAISCGSFHTCAITATGEAKCFGGNGNGQLGDGTTTNRATPKKVVGLNNNVTSIAAGPGSTCALTDQNETFCWGWNSEGQLGDGTLTNRLAATKVYGTP